MGDLTRRLETLEGRHLLRAPVPPRPPTEQERRERWLSDAKARRLQDTHSEAEASVRDLVALLAPRGELDGDLGHVRRRLAAWRPPLSGTAISRVSARMAYGQELPSPGARCPPEWREAFEAAEELLERYLAVPDETLAEILVALHEGRGEDASGRLEALGITPELAGKAVGPGADLPDEEKDRRLRECLADFYYGEKGYLVQQHITRLNEERSVEA